MTEKRFTIEKSIINGGAYCIHDTELKYSFPPVKDRKTLITLCKALNELSEENEQLKQSDTITDLETQIMHLKEENEQLVEICENLVNADANREYRLKQKIEELEEENEQLKQQLDYVQNAISNAIKHQKTDIGKKALQNVIMDYNEYMLGHKELQE